MIYEPVKVVLLGLLKCPSGPPPSPAGSPGSVQIFRASKNYLLYRIVVAEAFFVIAFLASCVFCLAVTVDPDFQFDLWFLVYFLPFLFLVLGLLAYFIIRLEYDMRYYIVTDRSLRIRQGVMHITEVTLTYANVQQLEIRQGPIQQLLGIADLMVRTAGGAVIVAPQQGGGMQIRGHRGVLTGIDNAPEIRDQINLLLRRYRDAGLGDPEDRRRQPPPPKAAPAARWSPAAIQRLLEIRDELRAWRLEQG